MFVQAKLILQHYIPDRIIPGMWFLALQHKNVILYESTAVIDHLEQYEAFVQLNGYPVEPYLYIVGNPNIPDETFLIATPEQIGWFDEGDVFEKATFSDKGDPYLEYPKNFYALEDLELHKLINPERRVNYGMFFAK